MAALQPAVDRIVFIIEGPGGGRKAAKSPSTISGSHRRERTCTGIGQGCILSYNKVIGQEQPDGSWHVNDERDSLTTNRHVRALMTALDSLGIPYEKGPLW
jgi:hypothetical protein